MVVHKTIKIVWLISDSPDYGIGEDKRMYNTKTGREKKQCLNNGSIGYWIGKKFLSLTSLRPKLYKPKKDFCPF